MTIDERTIRGIQSKIQYENGCHLWTGTHVKNITPYYNGKNVQKLLWSQSNPSIKQKIECIRTTCENSSCVNVYHMYVYSLPHYGHSWEDVLKRIMSHTDKDDDCMLWNGFLTETGYGRITFKRKCVFVHRLSYMTKIRSEHIPKYINGEVTNVMHLCGNSKCVNPDHLELGTVEDNAKHKIAHGTHQRGETSKRATITEATAQKILDSKRKKGDDDYETQNQRAKRFGTTSHIVRNIDNRQTWGHLVDSRYNTTSVRDKVNKRNREQLKLQKDIVLTEEQYQKAWVTLKNKSVEVEFNGWDCLEYTTALRHGYGQFSFYNITKNAHIWSCEIKYKRKRAEGEFTMHLCNNKACVNPDHLEFGTPKENSIYSILSGSKSCKLNPEIVREIRQSPLSCAKLATKYNVSENTIREAREGRTWTGVE